MQIKKYKCGRCGEENCYWSWEDTCCDCKNEEVKKSFESGLKEGGKNKIQCPWCGNNYDIADEVGIYEEGKHQLFCQKCYGRFNATTDMVEGFSVKKWRDKNGM